MLLYYCHNFTMNNFISSNDTALYYKLELVNWIPIDNLDWSILSGNYYAIDLLKNNVDKIDYSQLSGNEHKDAIKILEKNIDKINWTKLSYNHSALDLIEI